MADFRAVAPVLPCSPTNKGKKNLCGCAEKANRQWAFVAFWLSSYVNIKTAAAFANWLAPKKDALFSLIYFFGSFCIYYISHNYVIPQAIPRALPQTHSAFYPHRTQPNAIHFEGKPNSEILHISRTDSNGGSSKCVTPQIRICRGTNSVCYETEKTPLDCFYTELTPRNFWRATNNTFEKWKYREYQINSLQFKEQTQMIIVAHV